MRGLLVNLPRMPTGSGAADPQSVDEAADGELLVALAEDAEAAMHAVHLGVAAIGQWQTQEQQPLRITWCQRLSYSGA